MVKKNLLTGRILSIILSLTMVLTMMPMTVWADGEPDESDAVTATETAEAVAQIGEVTYTSLQDAFDAAKDGDTITLLKDIDDTTASEKEVFVFNHEGQTITLNMNGKSISGANDHWKGSLMNVKSGRLIIENTEDDFITISQGKSKRAVAVLVSGGTIEFKNKVKFTGQLKVTGDGKLEGNLQEGSLLINNGVYDTVSVQASNIYKFGTDPQIVALLGDGYAFARCDANGNLTDTDGNISALPMLLSGSDTNRNVKVIAHPTCTFTSSSGTYSCACGRPCPHTSTDSNGSCTVCGKESEAKVGTIYKWTLQEALDAAQDGETVTLLQDYNKTAAYNNSGAITIDLNGKTWNNISSTPLTINRGSVTLKNGKVLGGENKVKGIVVEKMPV